MRHLLRVKWLQLIQGARRGARGKWLLFIGLGIFFLAVLGFFSLRIFGYLHHLPDVPAPFRLFLAEKLLLMVFFTLFSLLVLSALVASLEVFFLSRDLQFLFSTPLSSRTIFLSKMAETFVISSAMIIFFSVPVLTAFCVYFAPHAGQVLMALIAFVFFVAGGSLVGMILGLLIPTIFSVRRMQTILSVFSVLLISLTVVFIRLSSPERLLNPGEIKEIFTFMSSFQVKVFDYLPFSWLSRSLRAAAAGEPGDAGRYLAQVGLLLGMAFFILAAILLLERRFYIPLTDKLIREGGGRHRSSWKPQSGGRGYSALWQKETKTFFRTPAQWTQLLVIAALLVIFVINLKMIPIPHESVKTIVALLNLGLIAFMGAGLNSRFTLPAVPIEGMGIVHLVASPLPRVRFFHFKLLFYLAPQLFVAAVLFATAHLILRFDSFLLWLGVLYILPAVVLLTLLALFFGLQIQDLAPLSAQHVVVSRKGLSFMLWSMIYFVLSLVALARPYFLHYFLPMFSQATYAGEVRVWLSLIVLVHLALIFALYRRSRKIWLAREF